MLPALPITAGPHGADAFHLLTLDLRVDLEDVQRALAFPARVGKPVDTHDDRVSGVDGLLGGVGVGLVGIGVRIVVSFGRGREGGLSGRLGRCGEGAVGLHVVGFGQAMARLAAIDHVKVIRVHTRMPVADPARITPELVRALKAKGKATYVVLHANHSHEMTDAAREACARFVDAGVPMLSQSVLLKGINDDPQTLGALMRTFVECRIKPYYLHHGDLAPGTSHLRTSIAEGQALMRALHGRSSGLCQPNYVLDIPGGHGKSPIGPNYLSHNGDGGYRIEDFNGALHCYPQTT